MVLFNTKADCTRCCLSRTFFNVCSRTARNKLKNAIFCKYYTATAFDIGFMMIACLKALSFI